MKRVFLLVILVVACGCKHNEYTGSEGEATLSFSPSFSAGNADSRATATSFEDGDRVGVYVVKQGQSLRAEFNAADNHLFAYFAMGDSLGSVPMAMYYPDKSTPVAVYAYYPYKYGGERFSALAMPFNVAKNQRAGDALTLSDLCLSVGDFAAPSASPRSLTFYHALSQVVVNVDHSAISDVDSLYSVRFLGVRSEVLVNLADGILTLQETRSSVITNSVAILPPQTFAPSKLIEIQVRMNSGELATYYFNPLTEITIEAKKRNTLSLKLRNDYTAELSSELAISPWIGGAGNGQLTERVSNDFTLTYLNPKQGFTNIDRVVLTIAGKEYEATNVNVKYMSDGTAKVTFDLKKDTPKEYPYLIEKVTMYVDGEEHYSSETITGGDIYRSGTKMMAITGIVVHKGATNCYMVEPGAAVSFGVHNKMEYFSTPNQLPASMKVLWQTGINHGSTAGSANMIIKDVVYGNGVCTVTANNGSGNAVVAAYTGANGTGTILWSWHIWVTATPGHSQALPAGNQAAAGGPGKLFMDRNLGAINATKGDVGAYGMFYQWGRKDPFTPSLGKRTADGFDLGAVPVFNAAGTLINTNRNGLGNSFSLVSSNTDNLLSSIKNPMVHYHANGNWTSNTATQCRYWRAPMTSTPSAYVDNRGDKGIYDPCPLGYRVAGNGAYKGFPSTRWAMYATISGASWLGIWWPATGMRTNTQGVFDSATVHGWAWSSTPSAVMFSYDLAFSYNGAVNPSIGDGCGYSMSVRCVME